LCTAEAKARLSELVDRAAAGERIVITKRGTPVLETVWPRSAPQRIDLKTLRRMTAGLRNEVLAFFTRPTEASIHVLPVSRPDFQTAARFADQYVTGLRAGDAALVGG
jgi:antitoxin (DNA-binding transcriptional repressor) of toxin-antitoxin stability system